jgi:hypothetical protein
LKMPAALHPVFPIAERRFTVFTLKLDECRMNCSKWADANRPEPAFLANFVNSMTTINHSLPSSSSIDEIVPKKPAIPSIVRPVLAQLAKMQAFGEIDQLAFESQLERLSNEELRPRGLFVVFRELPNGTKRFLIKSHAGGTVHEMIDLDPGAEVYRD